MTDRDDVDPEDWLTAQFADDPPKAPTGKVPLVPAAPDTPVAPILASNQPTELPPAFGGGFQWGLTPGGEPPPVPQNLPPVAPPPVAAPPPIVAPPTPPAAALPPVDPFATMAMPTVGQALEPIEPSAWRVAPVDSAFDGITEVIEAEIVGLETPEGEGVAASALDSLFGETQFRDYEGEPIISAAVVRVGGEAKPPRGPSAPLSKSQKILMWIAGGLVALLALAALFLVGTKLTVAIGPAPAISPSPSSSASPGPIVLPIGPVLPGEYQWDALLGGECLSPFESAWQDRYVVVDCTSPHPAQMLYRGLFDQTVPQTFPGIEELQKATNDLCSAPTVINYAIAGQAKDVVVSASFAADATDWDNGNFTYFCFATRSSGEPFTASIAVQQVAVTPTPTPKPKP